MPQILELIGWSDEIGTVTIILEGLCPKCKATGKIEMYFDPNGNSSNSCLNCKGRGICPTIQGENLLEFIARWKPNSSHTHTELTRF